MSTPTSVQIVPGNLVLSGNVDTNDTDNTFCIDRANGIVGIGQSLTSLVTGINDSNVLQINGEVKASRFNGDGSGITGLTLTKWLEDDNNVNNIHYSLGNVGIGGVASGTEALTVYGDLNIKNSGQLKFNGQTPVFSNWTSHADGIYRPTAPGDKVGIGGVPGTEELTVHGTVEANDFAGAGVSTGGDSTTVGVGGGKIVKRDGSGSFSAYTIRCNSIQLSSGTIDRDRISTSLNKTYFVAANHQFDRSVGGWFMHGSNSSSGSYIASHTFYQWDGDADVSRSVGVISPGILTNNLYIYSDERNKKNIKTIDTTTALDLIDKTNPVSYIDKKSNRKKSGVIAQEIGELMPHVVSPGVEAVCDIMIPCTFISKEIHDNTPEVSINKFKLNKPLSSDIELVPDQTFVELEKTVINDTGGLSKPVDTFLYFKHDEEHIYLLSIIAEATFELNDDDVCMLIGRVVNDALSVDYHSLFSVGLSAIKELNLQRVKDKKRIDDLEDTVANLLERINSLEGS